MPILATLLELDEKSLVIILQEPKLSSYIELMRNNISNALDIDISQISIKATTTDKLGFAGQGQGLAVEAICLIKNE